MGDVTTVHGGGFGEETVTLAPGPAATGWWAAYAAELAASGIGETSRRVIGADARHIVERGIFGAGAPGDARWPEGRCRTGAVMGAVQSGKTASMIGVAAMALDAGVDAVVVLGGTRTALWLQTADRFFGQLDVLPDRLSRRVTLPSPATLRSGVPEPSVAYSLTRQQASRAVERRRPILAVVMKNVAHLAEMSTTLHEELYPAAAAAGRPFHLLVIDDEADDSSVVDVEAADPSQVRQVPRRIRDLWESRHRPGETAAPYLYATYLAYTATPQASFLQDVDNPLAPRDFFASLRTPGPEGDWAERTATYRVPEGARSWYTGGQVFYRTLSDVPLCVALTAADDARERLIDTVRGYFVASAVRVLRAPNKAGPASARTLSFSSAQAARAGVVGPMSMLIHPSSAKAQHFETAASILAWAAGVDEDAGRDLLLGGARSLPVEGVRRDLHTRAADWRRWLDDYRRSAVITATALKMPEPLVPGEEEWDSFIRIVLDEVVPGTALAVINSDPNADDRPEFSPVSAGDGTWRAAANLSTIFVSGNVMSRGLTLEGLTTTFFSRRADEPLADTQMQMQRWFGYRGAYIDLCRVVLTEEQLQLFEQYHENDEALRREVLAAMDADPGVRPPLAVLQGRGFLATGKIARLRSLPLWPGPKPFVRHMNTPDDDKANMELLATVFRSDSLLLVPTSSGRQGVVLERKLSLLEAADLLDALVYPHHRPGRSGPEAERWASVAAQADIRPDDVEWPLYRPPAETSEGVDLGTSSPYWMAAYLRLWASALERRIPGLLTTDDYPVPWSLVDLDVKRQQQPLFSVGLRFGGGEALVGGPLTAIGVPVHPMKRDVSDGLLQSGWGARGTGAAGIRGDEFFDLRARGLDLSELVDAPRPSGSDGQFLFHVIDRGVDQASLALGVVLPLGGPDNVQAVRS